MDASSVENMARMFYDTTSFNGDRYNIDYYANALHLFMANIMKYFFKVS